MSQKRIILKPGDNDDEPPLGLNIAAPFKRLGVLNPAVIQDGSIVHLLSRLYYTEKGEYKSCIVKHTAFLERDSVRVQRDKQGKPIEELVLAPGLPHGQQGVEDMKVGLIKGEKPLHAFLVHYDGINARTEYLRTKEADPHNLLKWDRFGVFFPNITAQEAIEIAPNNKYKEKWVEQYAHKIQQRIPEENYSKPTSPFLGTKNCALFPHKIKREVDGKLEEHYGIIIRLLPDMQIIYCKDFNKLAKHEFWQESVKDLESHILLERKHDWEKSHIGLSYPPFEISDGFVIPYHGAIIETERDYKFGAALVDRNNPQKELGRTKKPILEATEPWEMNGIVSGNVVFPTGQAVWDGYLHIFYGARDENIGHIAIPEQEFLDSFN